MKHSTSPAVYLAALVAVATASASFAGTLRVVPRVEDMQIVVPVVLEGDVSNGVAALDFYLDYDPAVLEPAGIAAGSAAVSAGKQVLSNMTAPGRYKVILFGVNQNVLNSGEVVRVTLRRINAPANGQTDLKITGTHLASIEGLEMPSSGSSHTLMLEQDPKDEAGEEDKQDSPDTEPDSAQKDTEDRAAADDSQEGTEAGGPEKPAGMAFSGLRQAGAAQGVSLLNGAAGAPFSTRHSSPSAPDNSPARAASLKQLAKMRADARRLRDSIQTPGTPAYPASEQAAAVERSPEDLTSLREPAMERPASSEEPAMTGPPPGAPSAARPRHAAGRETGGSAASPAPKGLGPEELAQREGAANTKRLWFGAALGALAAGLLLLRRRLFS